MISKVIISEELLNRQPNIELKINDKKVVFNKSLSKSDFKVYKSNNYDKYQNFNLEKNHVLSLKRIK